MKDMTDIHVVLDRSGSMGCIRKATIDAFNEFLEGQRHGPGHAVISLYQFDNEYEVVYRKKDMRTVEKLNDITFRPRGATALLDAIGTTINGIGAMLSALPEYERPSKVIVAIITDGQENASTTYNRAQVLDMIEHQKEKYSWTFVYLGANQDAYEEAGQIGIDAGSALNFASTSCGIVGSMSTLGSGLSRMRSGSRGETFFEPDEQQAGDRSAGDVRPHKPKRSETKRLTPSS